MQKLPLQVSLPVMLLREGNQFVAYSPALDLSTAGNTLKQAQQRFAEVTQIFLTETIAQGTLAEVLSELGWKKTKTNWLPPTIVGQSSEMVHIPLTV